MRKEALFLLCWGISRLLTEIICIPFLKGFIGNIACFSKELIYDYILLHFLLITLKRSLSNALMSEKRIFQRYVDNRQISVNVLGINVNLVAETVNCSQGGMMVVLAKHMEKLAKKGVILNIDKELYRIIWSQHKGM